VNKIVASLVFTVGLVGASVAYLLMYPGRPDLATIFVAIVANGLWRLLEDG
jgi:hypothetical protein